VVTVRKAFVDRTAEFAAGCQASADTRPKTSPATGQPGAAGRGESFPYSVEAAAALPAGACGGRSRQEVRSDLCPGRAGSTSPHTAIVRPPFRESRALRCAPCRYAIEQARPRSLGPNPRVISGAWLRTMFEPDRVGPKGVAGLAQLEKDRLPRRKSAEKAPWLGHVTRRTVTTPLSRPQA
jgi:hypothetical protein